MFFRILGERKRWEFDPALQATTASSARPGHLEPFAGASSRWPTFSRASRAS